MLTNLEQSFINSALKIMRENFTIRDLSDFFGVDYRNMCAYVAGRKKLPLSLAFSILEYLGCRCVIFRNS